MKEQPVYLLKYISNDTYGKILKNNGDYIIGNLVDNRVDVDLNIRYLIKLGIQNIDVIVMNRLDDLLLSYNDFIDKMNEYEKKLTREGLVQMLENS